MQAKACNYVVINLCMHTVLLLQGEFFSIAKPVECPYTPTPLPPFTGSSNMMYVWLTEYVADSAGFVYQQAGILNYNVTSNMVCLVLYLRY